MTETLHVRWKPGTLDTVVVTSEHGTYECHKRVIEADFGRAAVATLYLRGSIRLNRPASVAAVLAHSAA